MREPDEHDRCACTTGKRPTAVTAASLRAPQYPVDIASTPPSLHRADRNLVEAVRPPDMPVLTSEQRGVFVRVADRLIPGGCGMPAAHSVDIGGRLLDRVLSAAPDLESDLVRGLDSDGHDLDHLAAKTGIVRSVDVRGGRCLLPRRIRARGDRVPGQLAKPVSPFSFPEYVAEGLLPLAAEELMT